MVSQVSGNDFNSWFHLNRNALPFGQRMGMVESSQTPNQPVKTEPTPVDNYQFTQPFAMNVGGVQGPSTVNPAQAIAIPGSVGHVTAEDNNTLISLGSEQGVGLAYRPSSGSNHAPYVGEYNYTKTFIA